MTTQDLIWDVLIIGGTVYLVDQRDWDPWTILLALLLLR